MKLIPLTHNKFAKVDDKNYGYLSQFKWTLLRKADKKTIYARANILGRSVLMHRVIINAKTGEQVDHKDMDGLNCQGENLRICTHSQNMMNRGSLGRSKYKGVDWYGKYQKWRARVSFNGASKHIGFFKSEENAATAYNIIAERVHGEFSRLNLSE